MVERKAHCLQIELNETKHSHNGHSASKDMEYNKGVITNDDDDDEG